jgi:hypothetical protein
MAQHGVSPNPNAAIVAAESPKFKSRNSDSGKE